MLTIDYEVGLGHGVDIAGSQPTPHKSANESEPYPDIIKPKGIRFISSDK